MKYLLFTLTALLAAQLRLQNVKQQTRAVAGGLDATLRGISPMPRR